MADYTLEGVRWGSAVFGAAGGLVSWAADNTVPGALVPTVAAAFADWAAHANIQFQQVTTTAAAMIDVRFGAIDGADKVLGQTGYTYYPPATLASADVELDTGEGWHLQGDTAVSNDGLRLFDVVLHEIGHAIGLGHFNDAPAIMNATLDPALTDLTPSDIDGVRALYGPAQSPFGTTTHTLAGPGGQVFALYDAILGRAPDPLGLEGYAAAVSQGASLSGIAGSLLASAEGQGREGAADNAAFVVQLYETALHRQPDGGGLQSYVDALNAGASRADVALGIALSSEHAGLLQGALGAGVFVPDANASSVARLYYGILDRAPDADGLAHFTGALDSGATLDSVARTMLASTEYGASHGALNASETVQSFYGGALGRQADPGGLQSYTAALANGAPVSSVALGIAEGDEARGHLVGFIEQNHRLG